MFSLFFICAFLAEYNLSSQMFLLVSFDKYQVASFPFSYFVSIQLLPKYRQINRRSSFHRQPGNAGHSNIQL